MPSPTAMGGGAGSDIVPTGHGGCACHVPLQLPTSWESGQLTVPCSKAGRVPWTRARNVQVPTLMVMLSPRTRPFALVDSPYFIGPVQVATWSVGPPKNTASWVKTKLPEWAHETPRVASTSVAVQSHEPLRLIDVESTTWTKAATPLVSPPLLTPIESPPTRMPVTSPVGEIVTEGLDTDQVIVPPRALPAASRGVAVSCSWSPTAMVLNVGETLSDTGDVALPPVVNSTSTGCSSRSAVASRTPVVIVST